MTSSTILLVLVSIFVAGASALNCRECTMASDDDTSCRDKPGDVYSKKCDPEKNRCLTVWAEYTHSRLGSYVLRQCAHSIVCNSDDPDIPALKAISVKKDLTRVECCETDNCNDKAHGTAVTGSLFLSLSLCAAAWMLAQREV